MIPTVQQGKSGSPAISRRDLLLAGSAGLLAALTGCSAPTRPHPSPPKPVGRPLALIYRGKASRDGCPEAVAALLTRSPQAMRTVFVGPGEDTPLTPQTLAQAAVYAQPGGGDDVDAAWGELVSYAGFIRDWVHSGGRYLGFCLGGYLAGSTPGFGLLPGDARQYVGSPGAKVSNTNDTVIPVTWNGTTRHMYFQDGPAFTLNPGARATVLATYTNGSPAAVITRFGSGYVGVVGPHPEADTSWYRDTALTNPDGINFDLGYDLIERTVRPKSAR